MKYPCKELNTHIKKILSDNPFYVTDRTVPDSFLGKKFYNEINLSDYFNHDTYAELSQHVLVDIACENLWENYITGKAAADYAILPDIDSPEAKEKFDKSFRYLYTNWHKFTRRSFDSSESNMQKYSDTDIDLPYSIFKAIYNNCPMFCLRVFPVVLFIIADSFYDFYNICCEKSGDIPKNLSPETQHKVFKFFYNLMTQDNKNYYLLSLLNSKGLHYAESSLKIGDEISTLALKNSKTDIESYIHTTDVAASTDADFDALIEAYTTLEDLEGKGIIEKTFKKLRKRYKDGYETKQKDRTLRSSTFPAEVMIGENFLAFLNFFINQPASLWSFNVDNTLSLYAINRITGWVSLYLLHNTFPYADRECGLSSFDNSHLYSLKYIMDQVEMQSDYHAEDVKKYPVASWLRHFLIDADKLYGIIWEEQSSDSSHSNIEFFKEVLQDFNSVNTFDEKLCNILDCMMDEDRNNYMWFDLDRLAYQLTYYTLGQYAKDLDTPAAEDTN